LGMFLQDVVGSTNVLHAKLDHNITSHGPHSSRSSPQPLLALYHISPARISKNKKPTTMAKNNPNSLRESVSSTSLQEQAARQRIAELEEQIASLKVQQEDHAPAPAPIVPPFPPFRQPLPYLTQSYQPIPPHLNQCFHPITSGPDPRDYQLPVDRNNESTDSDPLSYTKSNGQRDERTLPGITIHDGESADSNQVLSYTQANEQRNWRPYPAIAFHGEESAKDKALSNLYSSQPTLSSYDYLKSVGQLPQSSLITDNALKIPEAYTQPFCDFLTENPTVFHAVSHFETKLEKAGFKKVRILILS